jgi:hypothetical protein
MLDLFATLQRRPGAASKQSDKPPNLQGHRLASPGPSRFPGLVAEASVIPSGLGCLLYTIPAIRTIIRAVRDSIRHFFGWQAQHQPPASSDRGPIAMRAIFVGRAGNRQRIRWDSMHTIIYMQPNS